MNTSRFITTSLIVFLIGLLSRLVWKTNYLESKPSTEEQISKMKSPVVLIGKRHYDSGWSITLRDSLGTMITVSGSNFANNIGSSQNINERIK